MNIDQFIIQNNIRKADAIKVAKSGGLLTHYVIYLGRESEYTYLGYTNGFYHGGRNHHLFIANMQSGVKIIPEWEAMEFLKTYQPKDINRFLGNEDERERAIERALAKQNEENYNLILNNCEHFANYVQSGQPSSLQSKVAVAGGIALLIGIGAMLFGGGGDDKDA